MKYIPLDENTGYSSTNRGGGAFMLDGNCVKYDEFWTDGEFDYFTTIPCPGCCGGGGTSGGGTVSWGPGTFTLDVRSWGPPTTGGASGPPTPFNPGGGGGSGGSNNPVPPIADVPYPSPVSPTGPILIVDTPVRDIRNGEPIIGVILSNDGTRNVIRFINSLTPDQKAFWDDTNNQEIIDQLKEYLQVNLLPEDRDFALDLINEMISTGLTFDIPATVKSPFRIDMTAVSGNSPEELKFNEVYNKLLQSPKFKELFVNLFGVTDFINAKFKIEDIPNPNIKGTCQLFTYPNGKLRNDIIIDKELLNYSSDVLIAQTIIHECIHAYLNIKLRHPSIGMSIETINDMDFVNCINQYYNGLNGNQSQHDFFVDYLSPVISEILMNLKDTLLTPEQIDKVEHPSNAGGFYLYAPTNTTPPSTSEFAVQWVWEDYFNYISLIGLQNCTEFQNLYPINSIEYYYFLHYFSVGEAAFNN